MGESQQTCGISNYLESSSLLFNHQSQHVKHAFRSHRNSLHSLRRCRTFRSTRWRPLHRFCQITNRQLRRKFRQKILFYANRQKRGNSQSFSGNCAEIFGERFRVSRHRSSVQEPPSGKWFHISDASVSEVSEERVLKCQ